MKKHPYSLIVKAVITTSFFTINILVKYTIFIVAGSPTYYFLRRIKHL
jgi:hypothetical protein